MSGSLLPARNATWAPALLLCTGNHCPTRGSTTGEPFPRTTGSTLRHMGRCKMFGGRRREEHNSHTREGKKRRKGPRVSEASPKQKNARRVLKEAVAEAGGTSHVYVYRELVMDRANIPNIEAFWQAADYLAQRGYITEGSPDYWTFAVTPKGITEAAS